MKKETILILLLIVYSIKVYSQDKGKIRVFTETSDAIIKCDGETVKWGEFFEVDTGKHIIEAWAPTMKLETRTVRIDSGSIRSIRIEMNKTKAFNRNQLNLRLYQTNKTILKYGVPVVYLLYASSVYQNLNTAKDEAIYFESQAKKYQDKYENSIYAEDIRLNKLKFNNYVQNYNDALDQINNNNNVLLISTGSAAILTYFGWKIAKKLKRPKYTETPLLSSIQLNPVLQANYSGFSLTLKLH